MPDAVSNTSPLLYLYRIDAIDLLPRLFNSIWTATAVSDEFRKGHRRGHDVPNLSNYTWLSVVDPRAMPSEWLALDLGPGELNAMALALENPDRVVLLDDMLARRTAQAAGLIVWGTLKVLLEAKVHAHIDRVEPFLNRLNHAGMWMSSGIRQRVLALAGE